jgi:uncharacterized RDD family membrane protein YckC
MTEHSIEPLHEAQPIVPVVSVEAGGTVYAGLATRTLAFAVDALIIDALVVFVGAVVALCLSLLDIPSEIRTVLAAIGAAVALVWGVAYFVFFWSATGQTPGNRVMHIDVQDADSGEPISARRALVRFGALILAAIILCLGLLLILIDRQRRGLHDRLVGTVVVYSVDEGPALKPIEVPAGENAALSSAATAISPPASPIAR